MFEQASVRWSTGTLGLLAMLSMHLLVLQLTWHPSMVSADDNDSKAIQEIVNFIKEMPNYSEEEIDAIAQEVVDNVLPGLVEAMVQKTVNLENCVTQIRNSSDYQTCKKEADKLKNGSNANDTKLGCKADFGWLRCATKASCAVCSDKLIQVSNAIADGVSFVLAQDKCKEWANDSLTEDELVCTKNGNKLEPLFLQDIIACVKNLTENGTESCIVMAKNATDHYTDKDERQCRYIAMATECAIPKVCDKCKEKISQSYLTFLMAAEPFFNDDCAKWASDISQPDYYCKGWSPNEEIVKKIGELVGFIKSVQEFVDSLKGQLLPGVLDVIHEIAECPEKMHNSTDFQTCKKEAEGSHAGNTTENNCKRYFAITECVATSSCKLCSEKQVEVIQTLIDHLLSFLTENNCQEWANDRPNKTMIGCEQNGTVVSPLKLEKILACKKKHSADIYHCADIAKEEIANIKNTSEKVCKFAISDVKCSIPLVCEHCESGASEDYFKLLELFETRAKHCDEKWHTGPVELTCSTHNTEHSEHFTGNETTKPSGMATWLIVTIILLVGIVIVVVIVIFMCMKDDKKEKPSGKAPAEAKAASTGSTINGPKASSQIKQASTVGSSAVKSKIGSKVVQSKAPSSNAPASELKVQSKVA